MAKTLDRATVDKVLVIKQELVKLLFDEYGVDIGKAANVEDLKTRYKSQSIDSDVEWNSTGLTNGLIQYHSINKTKQKAKELDLPYLPEPRLNVPAASAKPGKFDVNSAISVANQIRTTRSSGKCAKFVRTFIEAGGISTVGRPIAAKDYVHFLPSIGFRYITSLQDRQSQTNWTSTQARPGDVAVMDHGKYGHICMYTGRNWVSDFVQNNMWVYQGNGLVHVFRHNNIG